MAEKKSIDEPLLSTFNATKIWFCLQMSRILSLFPTKFFSLFNGRMQWRWRWWCRKKFNGRVRESLWKCNILKITYPNYHRIASTTSSVTLLFPPVNALTQSLSLEWGETARRLLLRLFGGVFLSFGHFTFITNNQLPWILWIHLWCIG